MEWFAPSRSRLNPFSSRYWTRSRRLTDIAQLDGHLLEQVVSRGNLLAELLIRQDHLSEGIAQHRPAIFNVGAFGHHLGPLDELAHVAGVDLRILCGEAGHALIVTES